MAGAIDVLKTEFVYILQLCLGETVHIFGQHLKGTIGNGVGTIIYFLHNTFDLGLSIHFGRFSRLSLQALRPIMFEGRKGFVELTLVKWNTGDN